MAFRFLHPIFSSASPPSKFDKELMLRGIERVVDGTDPRLRAVSHYRCQLQPDFFEEVNRLLQSVR